MNYVSLFSGIEAASVAWKPLGWRALAFSEIEPFPCAVLAHHYPDVPNHGDVTGFDWSAYRGATIVIGGSPCQAFSVAGLRRGLDDPRGNLTLAYLAAVEQIRPAWMVWENVPGVLSIDNGRVFGAFLGALGKLGYGFAYRVLDAQHFGVPQRRRRVFVVGHLGDWRRAAAVLFERESLSGHPAPGREAGEGVTPILEVGARTNGDGCRDGDGIGQPGDPMYTLQAGKHHGVAAPLTASYGKQVDSSDTSKGPPNLITHSLRADGFDASEDGTGRGTPLVPMAFDSKDGTLGAEGVTSALTTNGEAGHAGGRLAIAFSCKDHAADAGSIAPSLRAMGHDASHANAGGQVAVAFQSKASAVRRLTPKECARLQGFPDDYLDITYRGKPAADGNKYKALGNSFAVPVVRWIGGRIAKVAEIA